MIDYEKTESIKNLIIELLAKGGISAQVEFEDSLIKGLVFNISTRDSRILIGRQGATLHALETLAHAIAARKFAGDGQPLQFSLDVDDYKRKREWYLKETAKNAVDFLKRSGRPVTMEPMPNYDRRIIHAYLQDNYPEVVTESQGQDPNRKIIVKLR